MTKKSTLFRHCRSWCLLLALLPLASWLMASAPAAPSQITLSEVSQTAAMLEWAPDATATSYDVKVSTASINVSQTAEILDVTDMNADGACEVTGLQAGTTYYVGLRAKNGGGPSEWAFYTFTTPCGAQTLPLTANFNNGFPICWQREFAQANQPALISSPRMGTNGNSLRLLASGENNQYVFTPYLKAIDLKEAELSFYAYGTIDSTVINVGLLYSSVPEMVISNIYTIVIPAGQKWIECFVPIKAFSNYLVDNDADVAVAIYTMGGTNSAATYIDDISLATSSECTRPFDVKIQNFTATTITLDWTQIGTPNSWEVRCISGTDTIVATTNSKPYTITGLTAETTYSVSVRSICGANKTDYSSPEVTQHLPCGAMPLPFYEGFGSTTAGQLPNCWSNDDASSGLEYKCGAEINENNPYNGMAMKFESSDNQRWEWNDLLLPVIDLQNETAALMSFAFVNPNNADRGDLKVLVSTDGINYDTIASGLRSSVWLEKDIDLNAYAGNLLYIKFRGVSSYGGINDHLWIDDIRISQMPACRRPADLSWSGLTGRSIDVEWTPQGSETSWLVKVGNGNFVTTNEPKYTITGLTPNTDQNIALTVQAYCAPDTSAALIGTNSFTTLCDTTITVGFYEDFAAYAAGSPNLPDCWSKITEHNTFPNIGSSYYSITKKTGTLSFGGGLNIVALPPTDQVQNKMLVFYLGTISTSSWAATPNVVVGVMTDPSDKNTFVPIQTCALETKGIWKEFRVKFDAYTGDAKYIAIRSIATETTPQTIDYLRLLEATECDYPDAFVIDSITSNVARISIEDTYGNTAWDVKYGPVGFDVESAGTLVTLNAKKGILTALNADTQYDIYLRANCGTTTSVWMEKKTIKTKQTPVALPLTDTFDNASWQFSNGTQANYWTIGTAATVDNTPALYITAGEGYGYLRNTDVPVASWASKTFTAAQDGGYLISFDYKCEGRYQYSLAYDYMRAFIAPITADLVAGSRGDTYLSNNFSVPAGWIELASGPLHSQTTWTNTTTEEWLTAAEYQIVFLWYNQYSSNSTTTTPSAAVDNVTVRWVDCPKPSQMVAANVSDTSATLSWKATVASAYNIKLFTTLPTTAIDNALAEKEITVSDSRVTITGLLDNTTYYGYVQGVCGEEASDWSNGISFTTECAAKALPYTEGFETANTQWECWKTPVGTAAPYYASWAPIASSGTYSLRMAAAAVVLPRVDAPLSQCELSAKIYTTIAGAGVSVYITKTADAQGDLLTTFNVTTTAAWEELYLSFEGVKNLPNADEYKYIRIETTTTGTSQYVYLDDLNLDLIPSCAKPTAASVTEITNNSAVLNWVDNNDNRNQWQVQVLKSTTSEVIYSNTVSSKTPLMLESLASNTQYALTVRGICAVGDTSVWSTPAIFRTACGTETLPFAENFQTTTSLPACWSTQQTTSNKWNYNSRNMRYDGNYLGLAALVSPPINVENSAALTVDYQYEGYGFLSIMYAYISLDGVMPATEAELQENGIELISPSYDTDLQQVISLDNYVGETVYVMIIASSKEDGRYLYLNSVNVVGTSCATPTDVTINNITPTAATVAITGEAASWDVAIVTAGTSITSATPITITTTAHNFTNLMSGTTYDVYVRANCGAGGLSEWAVNKFTTECVAMELPYNISFTGTYAIPNCYNTLATYTDMDMNITYPIVHPMRGLMLAGNSMLVLPEFNAPISLTKLDLNLSIQCEVVVGIITDVTDVETFIPIDTISTNLWNSTHTFASYEGTGRIALKSLFVDFDGELYADPAIISKISLEYYNGCDAPVSYSVQGKTSNQAQIVVSDQNITQWQYILVEAGKDTTNLLPTLATTDTIEVSGLTMATNYDLYLRNYCAQDKQSKWIGPIAFTTPCGTMALPYTDDFASYTEVSTFDIVMPSCWTQINSNTSVGLISNYTSNNQNWLRLMGQYPATYVVMPEFEEGLNNIRIRFNYYDGRAASDTGDNTAKVFVGYVTELNESNFVVLKEIDYLNTTGVFTHDVAAAGIPQGARLAFTVDNLSAANGRQRLFYIYNLSVTPICPAPAVTIESLTATTATLTWGTVADSIKVSYNGTEKTFENATRCTIDGLTADAANFVTIKAYCNDLASWSESTSISIYTLQATAATVPYTCGFESEETETNEWTFRNALVNKWTVGSQVAAQGNGAMYISNDGNYAYNNTATSTSWALRLINFEQAGVYSVKYTWKNIGEEGKDYLRAFLVPANKQFVADQYIGTAELTPNGWYSLDNGAMSGSETWKEVDAYVTIPEAGSYNLVFLWKNDNANGQTPAAIDAVSIQASVCTPVENIITYVTADTALRVTWADDNATQWEVACVQANASIADATPIMVTEKNYTFANLTPATSYVVYVRTVCGESTTSPWVNSTAIRTFNQCATLPYSYGFEDGADMTNWDLNATNQNTWARGSAASYNGNYGLYVSANAGTTNGAATNLTGTRAYAIRYFKVENEGLYEINFQYRSPMSEFKPLHVHLMDASDEDYSLFNNVGATGNIGTFSNQTSWANKHAERNLTPGLYKLVFYFPITTIYSETQNIAPAIDDLKIREITCFAPTGIKLSSLFGTEAELAWNNLGQEYRVQLTMATNLVLDTIVANAGCKFENLLPGATYSAKMQSICQVGDTSLWSTAFTFSMPCLGVSAPYADDFEGALVGATPSCWILNGTTAVVNSNTTGNSLRISGTGYAVMPDIEDNLAGLRLSFTHTGAGSVGYMTNLADENSFVELESLSAGTNTVAVEFNEVEGSPYIAFRSSGSLTIDDIRIACYGGVVSINRSFCQGNVTYLENGFNISNTDVTLGTNKFTNLVYAVSANACDTLYELTIEVTPRSETVLLDTVCAGYPYTNHGLNIESPLSQRYFIESLEAANGCDSLIYLDLHVIGLNQAILRDTICAGETYTINGETYTTSGTYPIYLRNAVQVGSYTCDSIISLRLHVLPQAVRNENITITVEELPYTFGGITIPAGQEPGISNWTDTIEGVAYYGCDSIVALQVEVVDGSALSNTTYNTSLTLIPTLVERGGSVMVKHNFDAAERNNLLVEVYGIVGNKVATIKPDATDIVITEFRTSGIYLVRITTGTGRMLTGQVIVK